MRVEQTDCCLKFRRCCLSLRKLPLCKIILLLALGILLLDLPVNAMRRGVNLSVYRVFDLEAWLLKCLGYYLLHAGCLENEHSTLDSKLDFRLSLVSVYIASPIRDGRVKYHNLRGVEAYMHECVKA